MKAKTLINKNNELVITSEKTRSQHKNLNDALGKARQIIKIATFVAKETPEEVVEKVKEFKRRENEKRLEEKKMKSSKKFDRRNIE